ncbi:MAG: hypothetical protein E6Q58_05445 [Niabella sp.]|nr:MAG: hypothetical protein E6Q58_05445 [Niabella sp.]
MRRSFLSVLVLASILVGADSCKKGDTGPAGPAGPTGTAGQNGAPGAPGAPGAAGATGKDGTRIFSGSGVPAGSLGVVNDFYFDATAGVLYGPKTSATAWPATGTSLKGANGANGANGAQGATGATGAAGEHGGTGSTGATGSTGSTGSTGATGATGATGNNGTNFMAGAGAPTCATGNIGDYYFDTVTSTIYGPKMSNSGNCWGTGTAIGVTATPRSFFLDISLNGKTDAKDYLSKEGCCWNGGTTKVSTYVDTSLVIDREQHVFSDYQMNHYDVNQVIGVNNYLGWWDANGREILFIDESQKSGALYMVPTDKDDLAKTEKRRFIYTRDPANQGFIEALRNVGMWMEGMNPITDPYWHASVTPPNSPIPLPPGVSYYPHLSGPYPILSPSTPAEFSGHTYVFAGNPPTNNANNTGRGTSAGGLRYGWAAPVYDLTNFTNVPAPSRVFTMSDDLYHFLLEQHSTSGGKKVNALCTWMYSEAFVNHPNTNGKPESRSAVVGDYVNFHPYWKKADKVMTGDNYDYQLRKQISLNLGKIRYESGPWQDLDANLTALGAAWTYARDSASVDFSFTYPMPKGEAPTFANLRKYTRMPWTNDNVDHVIPGGPDWDHYFTTYRQAPIRSTFNCYNDLWNTALSTTSVNTPIPGPVTAVTNPMWAHTFYNSWVSLNNSGAFNINSNGTGIGYGSGPINDYGKNHADGGAYDVTPPTYEYDHWTHINGKAAFNNAVIPWGTITVPAPKTNADYPWGGIVVRNGIIYVNYFIGNGGAVTRCSTRMHFQERGYEGEVPYKYWWQYWNYQMLEPQVAGNCFTYYNLIPNGYSSTWVNWNHNAYTQGPWPSNQNRSCEGFYWRGEWIPSAVELPNEKLIRFKIQTQPSSRHDGIVAEKK